MIRVILAALLIPGIAFAGSLPFPSPSVQGLRGSAAVAYTIAIIGDTQEATDGGTNQTHLQTMVDEIATRSTTETIVGVLQVGDYVQNGTFLPLSSACTGATKTLTIGECIANGSEGTCDAYNGGDGCDWDGTACLTCGFTNTVNTEWSRGNTIFDDLEPGADTTNGVPFMFPRGNHDNLGGETDLDDEGIDPHWTTTVYEGLETSFASSPQYFEHLVSEDFGTEGIGRVFRIRFGSQNVNIVAPPYAGGGAYSSTVIDWVVEQGALRGEPWILLAHDLSEHGGTLLAATVNASPTPPGLIAAISGHSPSARSTTIDADGERPVARLVWDMSNAAEGSAWAEYLYLDFWPDTDEIRVRQRNPVADTETDAIARTSFEWPTGLVAAVPYDLGTLPSIVADVEWAIPPSTSSTVTVCASGCDLTSIPWTTSNQRVEVASGSYSGGTVSCDDCEFVGAPGATVTSLLTFNGDRIAMTGEWTTAQTSVSGNPTDLFLDNVHMLSDGDGFNWTGAAVDGVPWQRFSVINSTFEVVNGNGANDFALFTQAESGTDGLGRFTGEDAIFANVYFKSDAQGFRFQSIKNLVIVDSAANLDNGSTNSFRFHHGVEDLYVRDSIFVRLTVPSEASTLDITNAVIDNATRYVAGAGEAFGYTNQPFDKAVNCTIDNSQVYSSGGGVGSPPGTADCTGTNPNVLSWDGSTLPNVNGSSRPAPMTDIPYGADH